MSIATSRQERQETTARIGSTSTEVLERDLVTWTIASLETAADHRAARERLQRLQELHAEEHVWIALIAEELRQRRSTPGGGHSNGTH